MSDLLNLETALNSLAAGASSAPFILGPVTFTGVEVPSAIEIGGGQVLAVSKLPGGDRVIQPMGPDPEDLSWSGLFIGPNALARAQQLVALRDAGAQITLSFAGYLFRVVIQRFSVGVQQRGGVAPYQIACVVQPTVTMAASNTPAAVSSLIPPDLTAAATSIANASALAATAAGQAEVVLGQVTPIASLVGLGGPLAHAQDSLTAALGLASAGTNLSAAPAAAAGLLTNLQSASTGLMNTIGQAGANIDAIQAAAPPGSLFSDAASLQALTASMGAQAAAVMAGGFVNRAATNAALAIGQTPGAPVVHS